MMKVVFIAALLLTVSSFGYAQTKRRPAHWQGFSPIGKDFKIDVPTKPRRIYDLDGDTDPNGYKSIDVYGVSQLSPIRREYQIIVLVPSEGVGKEHPEGNELGGLEFTIGGDNAEPKSQTDIKVGNFKGKELIYALEGEEFGHGRGRIIDAGKTIFILIYATNTASDLSSSAAARFFSSFQVT